MSTSAVSPLVRIEGHYRRALTKRWFELHLRALVYTTAVTSVATLLLTSSPTAFLLAFPAAAITYPLTVYPILSARRSFITSPPKVAPTTSLPTILWSLASSLRILYLLATYLSFGATFGTVYCLLVTLGKSTREFGLWSATPRHPWHLNERFIFLVLGNALLFFFLGIRDVLLKSNGPTWPTKRVPLWIRARESIIASLDQALPINGIYCIGYSLTYFIFRKGVWRFVLLRFGGLVRPFIVNFTKTSRNTITWSLILHVLLLSVTSVAVLRIPTAVINAYFTHPLNFDPFMRKSAMSPDRYLLAALQSQNPYHLHFTLAELQRSVHDPVRRRAIFNDISRTPPLTHEIWQALLLLLARANYTLVTRGGSRPLITSSAPRQAAAPYPRAMPIKQADIFRPVVKKPSSFGLSLLDGPVRMMVPPEPVLRVSEKAKEMESKALEQAKQLQSNVVGRIEAAPGGQKVLSETAGLVTALYEWMGTDWARRNSERAFPEQDAARLIINIFATLAVASTEEDTYGHVQQVLPATLEAIVRFRSSIASLEGELVAQSVLLGRAHQAAVAEVRRQHGPPQTGAIAVSPTSETPTADVDPACEIGVRRIGDKFGRSLSAFRFPPSIASVFTDICRPAPEPEGGESKQDS